MRVQIDQRSPLRRAVEDGTATEVIAAIRSLCTVTADDCWLWQRKVKRGYAVTLIAGRTLYVHRIALEARLGASLGKQPAHHLCATSNCCNPDHLAPITAAANLGEMHARTYMTQRIRDLEVALASLDPTHPLLAEVSLTHAA